MSRYFTMFLPLIVFLVLVALFGVMLSSDRNPQEIRSARVGGPVPAFEIAGLMPGEAALGDQDLTSLDQPVVVNFFASWCVPCRAEHDSLMELSEVYGVRVIGIAYKDSPDAARAFLAELGNPFARTALDLSGRVGIDWGVSGVPESYIVSPDGTVVYRHWGPIVGEGLKTKMLPALTAAGYIVPADLASNVNEAAE